MAALADAPARHLTFGEHTGDYRVAGPSSWLRRASR